jgi:hypothetical protein
MKSEHELAEEVREHLRRSVKSQMVSDVPVGAFLSAGLDSSSIVTMMAAETSPPVRTYTVTFPSKYILAFLVIVAFAYSVNGVLPSEASDRCVICGVAIVAYLLCILSAKIVDTIPSTLV